MNDLMEAQDLLKLVSDKSKVQDHSFLIAEINSEYLVTNHDIKIQAECNNNEKIKDKKKV